MKIPKRRPPRRPCFWVTVSISRLLALLLVLASGCGEVPSPSPRAPVTRDKEEAPDHARRRTASEILDRAATASEMAKAALQHEGSTLMADAFAEYLKCTDDCEGKAKRDSRTVGAYAALAIAEAKLVAGAYKIGAAEAIAAEPHAEKAEEFAEKARDEAEKILKARIAVHGEKVAEANAVTAAEVECDAHDARWCEKRCNDKSGPHCFAIARRSVTAVPPDMKKATASFKRACDLGVVQACDVGDATGLAKLEADRRAEARREEEARKIEAAKATFHDVVEIADDIASKMFVASNAAKLNPRAVRRMKIVIEASISERYCPARKVALATISPATFAALASKHCKEDPPSGTGISGTDVPLPSECRQVFGSACP